MDQNTAQSITAETVWAQFHEPLARYLRRRVNDEQAAADLLQDVFLKVYLHLDSVRDDERLERWLYRLTRNTVIDYYRASRPQAAITEFLPADDDTDPDEELRARLAVSLRAMLASLPPGYALALQLTDLEGLSQQELAERLGISVSGAKSRVQRARKMLRAALLACCHFEFDRHGRVIDYTPHRCDCRAECAC